MTVREYNHHQPRFSKRKIDLPKKKNNENQMRNSWSHGSMKFQSTDTKGNWYTKKQKETKAWYQFLESGCQFLKNIQHQNSSIRKTYYSFSFNCTMGTETTISWWHPKPVEGQVPVII